MTGKIPNEMETKFRSL